MNYITITFFILSTMMVGCKDTEKEVVYQKSTPIKKFVKVEREKENLKVFENEKISEDIFAVDVRAKDRVIIQLKGTKYVPQFDKNIFKNSSVTWTDRACFGFPENCVNFPRQGSCKLSYTKRLDDEVKGLDLTYEAEHSLRVYIGDRKIDLGTPEVKEGQIFEFDFTVTPDMVKDSDELYIRILPPSDSKTVRTGFVEAVDCPASTKPHFKIARDTSFIEDIYSSYEEFDVTLQVKY